MTEKKKINYLLTKFEVIDRSEYRHLMTSNKGIQMTYEWLKRHIIRAPMKTPWLNEIYENFYLKNLLASSITQEDLAEDLNLSVTTIKKNLALLESAKAVVVKKLKTKKREGAQKPQHVYILGKWKTYIDDDGKEKYREFDRLKDVLFDDIGWYDAD